MLNLLADTLPAGGRYVDVGEAALYALIGFIVVFVGIAFLILIVWAVGKLMTSLTPTEKTKVEERSKQTVESSVQESLAVATGNESDEISEETVAIITAAIMAYYQKNNPKCEFTVKRIKRI